VHHVRRDDAHVRGRQLHRCVQPQHAVWRKLLLCREHVRRRHDAESVRRWNPVRELYGKLERQHMRERHVRLPHLERLPDQHGL